MCFRKKLKVNNSESMRNQMYENGLSKIENELDIRYITRELRTLRFISNVLLTKTQRFMIPHFKQNLINTAIEQEDSLLNNEFQHEYQLDQNIEKTIERALNGKSKLDIRVLKNVDNCNVHPNFRKSDTLIRKSR